jgi:tetratricopeptide (TPR) repeat protein
MFWLTTASVMRGELPQAEETIAVLLRLAEARDDRPALLNAMRGQGMIRLFMGHLTGAYEVIGRAYDAFEASSEGDRLAARAAGQDAGVADLALMSWALWLLGRADAAIMRMDAAIRRADAIGHPHSQAYAAYYACILHALRGEFITAQGHAERCIALSEEHGFRQWRLARALRGICVASLDRSPSALGEIDTALDEYRSAGYQLAITALDVLLCPPLLIGHAHEAALELIEHGLATTRRNSERILHARTLELRAATDRAALWIDQGRREEALNFLAPIHASFTEGFDTQDLKQAKALLDRLR